MQIILGWTYLSYTRHSFATVTVFVKLCTIMLAFTWKPIDEEGWREGEVTGQYAEGAVQPGGGVALQGVVGRHLDHPSPAAAGHVVSPAATAADTR